MDWKRGILRVEISDAILVKKCHDDLRNEITETVLKTVSNILSMLPSTHVVRRRIDG